MSKTSSIQGLHPLLEPEVREILSEPERFENDEEPRVGFESEYGVVDGTDPSSHKARERAIDDLDFADNELGAGMAETKTHPMQVDDLTQIAFALGGRENRLMQRMREEGLSLVRYGTNPFIDVEDIPLTKPPAEAEEDRYSELVNEFNELRREHKGELDPFGIKEQINPNTAALPAAICSTQVNIQAQGWEDALEKANYAQMILPEAIALSGASRIIDGKDIGYADTRMQLWEETYNTPETPSKVGAFDSFLESPEDRFSRMGLFADDEFDHPRDYEEDESSPLETAVKEDWKDVKVKITDDEDWKNIKEGVADQQVQDYLVVEVRPYSMQPSVAEEVALHGYTIGRIAYAQEYGESLEIDEVHENRIKAMEDGLEADQMFYDDGEVVCLADTEEVLEVGLEKAIEGLDLLDIEDPGYLDILERRIENGTPSDISAERYNRLRGQMSDGEALREAVPILDDPIFDPENPLRTHYDRI